VETSLCTAAKAFQHTKLTHFRMYFASGSLLFKCK